MTTTTATTRMAYRCHAWKRRVRQALSSGQVTMWMANVTVWSLFGDDLRLLATDANADLGFLAMVYICLTSFAVELAISMWVVEGYAGSFYFWLDIVATLSLLADIPAFMRSVGMDQCQGVDSYGTTFDDRHVLWRSNGSDNDMADGGFARAGRASRAATRAGRIVRIIRLIRLVKIFKTYEATRERKHRDSLIKQKRDSTRASFIQQADMETITKFGEKSPTTKVHFEGDRFTDTTDDDEFDDEDSLKDFEMSESRVGQKLGDLTTKRVVIGVLLMLFVLPVFDVNLYPVGTIHPFYEGGLSMAHETLINSIDQNDGFYHGRHVPVGIEWYRLLTRCKFAVHTRRTRAQAA